MLTMSIAKRQKERSFIQVVSQLFPDEKLILNARREINIKSPTSGKYLEIDVLLPELKLGFEFQVR